MPISLPIDPMTGLRNMIHSKLPTLFWQLIVVVGIGPLLVLKYYRFTYRPSAINILQQLEHSQPSSHGDLYSTTSDLEGMPLNFTCVKNIEQDSIYQPLLTNTVNAAVRKETTPSSLWGVSPSNNVRTKHM